MAVMPPFITCGHPLFTVRTSLRSWRLAQSSQGEAELATGKDETGIKRPVNDRTAWLISLPWLVIAGAPIEYLFAVRQMSLPFMIAGGALFITATGLRAKAHLDIQGGFSVFLETRLEQELVTSGLYHTIRHPLYLANVLLLIACPLFLGVSYAWTFTLLGIARV